MLRSDNIKINKLEISDYKWFSADELNNPRLSESVKLECLQALELARKL